MKRRTLAVIFVAPVVLPLVLILTAAMAISVAAIGGGIGGGGDVPAGGAPGGQLRPGVEVPPEYLPIITRAVQTANHPMVNESVLAALLKQESGYQQGRTSSAGASGPAQFMPATWARYGVDGDGDGDRDIDDPVDAVVSAAKYLAVLAESTKGIPGDPTANMLAAYNAGPGAVQQYQGVPPYAETQNYVQVITTQAREWGATPGMIGAGGGGPPPPVAKEVETTGNGIVDTAVAWAVAQVGSWYHFGGSCTDPFGPSIDGHCDCSSLMQQAYRNAGVALPRTAGEQSHVGDPVDAASIRPGDLVAMLGSDGTQDDPGHIAMYIGNGYVVEAPFEGAQVGFQPVRAYDDVVTIRRIVTG